MVELKTNLPATGRLTEYGATAMNSVNFLDSMESGFGGLTALPMATRSGDVPQDLILYRLRSKLFDDASLEKMLYEAAGLLGLSGISGDTRVLQERPDRGGECSVFAMTNTLVPTRPCSAGSTLWCSLQALASIPPRPVRRCAPSWRGSA
jgi:hypothetical protein